jgi:hypothetical protein
MPETNGGAGRPYDADFPEVALGDIVRFKAPYRTRVGNATQEYRYGIVVEILQVTPRGKVRNVSAHLYTRDGRIYVGPNQIPELCGHPHNSGIAESAVMRSRARRLLQSLPLKGEHST